MESSLSDEHHPGDVSIMGTRQFQLPESGLSQLEEIRHLTISFIYSMTGRFCMDLIVMYSIYSTYILYTLVVLRDCGATRDMLLCTNVPTHLGFVNLQPCPDRCLVLLSILTVQLAPKLKLEPKFGSV
jgi:hypothetical protein